MPTAFARPLGLLWLTVLLALLYHGLVASLSLFPGAFVAITAFAYALVFTLPVWLIAYLLTRFGNGTTTARWPRLLIHTLVLATIGLLYANYKLYAIYGFYINGFVLNILLTPGGIGALGLSQSFFFSLTCYTLLLITAYTLAVLFIPFEKVYRASIGCRTGTALLIATLAAQAFIFSLCEYTGNTRILMASKNIPWYAPVTAKSFYKRMGIAPRTTRIEKLTVHKNGNFQYPLVNNARPVMRSKYNIVWLVAESLRADMLTPEIMPNSFRFAQNNIRFRDHYSGGNGTRMGMFTQFYGLYGNYWFDALHSQTPPAILNAVQANDYRMKAFTSATFTYPEFDKTIFSQLRSDQMQSYVDGYGWERDRKNTSDLINFLKDSREPTFAFMFFESSHANYYFPESSVIKPDFLEDFDYLATDIDAHIGQIKNRYINATHHLDSQIARILDYLKNSGKLDNTIVLITGDHGEEFMEKGRWGHNSTFSQEQIRVPLVLHIPGRPLQIINRMTSHLDIPATLAAALGIDASSIDLGFGNNLLAPDYQRTYTVASDWHGSVLISRDSKFTLSPGATVDGNRMTSLNDQPLAEDTVLAGEPRLLNRFLSDMAHYY